jgi:hypothetical protein
MPIAAQIFYMPPVCKTISHEYLKRNIDHLMVWFGVLVLYVTFNNILVIAWRSVLLVEEARSTQRKPPTCRKSLTNFIN